MKATKFLKYKDRKSSERIYKAIKNYQPSNTLKKKIMQSELYLTLFKRFRKSKRYFPVMKLAYKLMRKYLPVEEKLNVFDIGLGKQASDRPTSVYTGIDTE